MLSRHLATALLAVATLARCAPAETLPATATPPPTPSTTTRPVRPDPARGEALFRAFVPAARYACVTCHLPNSTQALLGPGLAGVGDGVSPCDPQQDLEDYLRESILEPDACLTPGFSARLMPSVYAEVYSEQDIDDLVAWMLTLRQTNEAGQ
ncbi:MAG: cytochrome c [Anaerolineaceae bacterium]|nr:cytochrome c [Anaerolineaceae bacterium]MCY4024600.1 cytochrome c [Anaerolineaceae bacterium]